LDGSLVTVYDNTITRPYNRRPSNETRTALEIEREIVETLVREYPELLTIKEVRLGDTELHFACQTNLRLALILCLIQLGPEALRITNWDGETPLRVACGEGGDFPYAAIKVAIDTYPEAGQGVDRNANLPLHKACCRSSMQVIKLLLKVYPEAACKQNTYGDTPLHCLFKRATSNTSIDGQALAEIVGLVIDGYPRTLTMQDADKYTPLHNACHRGAPRQVIQLLLDQGLSALQMVTDQGDSALHLACFGTISDDSVDNIQLLVERDPSLLHKRNNSGQTALHVACKGFVPIKTLRIMIDCSQACPVSSSRHFSQL
jgi:ankyrin repeat protein